MTDIICIGHITHDKIITPNTAVDMAGGTSFYFAHAISHLPQRATFQLVTKIGDDAVGEVEKMRRKNIDVKCFHSAHTVYFENRYGADSNNRTQRVLETADPFTIDEMRQVADARVYHLGSLMADNFSPEVVEYLAAKGTVSIDVQGYLREVRNQNVYPCQWKDKERILASTGIIKLNEHEMETVTGHNDPKEVALHLSSFGVGEVVITLGSYGSVIYANQHFYHIPAYRPRQVVDATGCGDTYSTGYLYMRAQGAGYAEAGRFAAAMCTLKLEHSGPFDGTIADIKRVIGTE